MSPTKNVVVNILHIVKNNLQKNINETKQNRINLKLELQKVQYEMSKIVNQSITKNSESRKTLILECFAASRIKNDKSRRYSEN